MVDDVIPAGGSVRIQQHVQHAEAVLAAGGFPGNPHNLTEGFVEISKTDMTDSKEVPGAKLTILDKDGKVVEEKKGEFLKRGKYAL